MAIADDYLCIMDGIATSIILPPIREIHIAPYRDDPEKSSKFGAIVLDDNSVGLTYVDLDDAMRDLQSRSERRELIGCSPIEAVRLYAGKSAWQRSLGMAAINAISQHIFKRSRFALTGSDRTMDLLGVEPGDHIGMVGYFPPLVEQIRTVNAPLTVVELDERWLRRESGLHVTLDASRLSECNKILFTATVLVNQTLDELLPHAKTAEVLILVGPTAGCLPDPLFERGITAVGGRQVTDLSGFTQLWRTQQPWRQATQRYTLAAEHYPGYEALVGAAEAARGARLNKSDAIGDSA